MTLSVSTAAQGATHCEEREGWAVFSDGAAYPAVSILCGDVRARALAFAWSNPMAVLEIESKQYKDM
jgi:hypothetical protein